MGKRKSKSTNRQTVTGFLTFDPQGKPLIPDPDWCPTESAVGSKLIMGVLDGQVELKFGWVPMSEIDVFDEFWEAPSEGNAAGFRENFIKQALAEKYVILWLYERDGRMIMFDNYGPYQAAVDLKIDTVLGVLLGPVTNTRVQILTRSLSTEDAQKYTLYQAVDMKKYLIPEE